jgi:hypothetical protein
MQPLGSGHDAERVAPANSNRGGTPACDFNRAALTTTARELYDQVLKPHPNRMNPSALWASARALKP